MGGEGGGEKIVWGRIPWQGRRVEIPDSLDMAQFLAAASPRANEILETTADCDKTEAARLRDYLLMESDVAGVASYILGASPADIEGNPSAYHGAALAFKKLQEIKSISS